ncbi:unnamed protein product [Ascophyllum nodosum]
MQKELRARLQRAAVYLDPFMGWPSDDAQHSCSGRDLDDALRPQWLRARQQLRVCADLNGREGLHHVGSVFVEFWFPVSYSKSQRFGTPVRMDSELIRRFFFGGGGGW